MALTVWRLTKAKYAAEALSGHGSMLRAGRWHRKGVPLVYAAESPALALVETLVHVAAPEDLLAFEYVVVPLYLEEKHLEQLGEERLPEDWNVWPWPVSTQALGTRWLREERSVALEVPSAVVPRQRNYLLNPRHLQFDEAEAGPPEPFPIDARLLQ